MSGTNKSPLALSPPPPPSLSLLSRSLSLLSSLSPVSSLWPHWAAWVGLALNGPRLAGYGPPGPPAAACWAWPSPALIRTGPGPVGPSWAEDSERRLRCPPDRATVARDSGGNECTQSRSGPRAAARRLCNDGATSGRLCRGPDRPRRAPVTRMSGDSDSRRDHDGWRLRPRAQII